MHKKQCNYLAEAVLFFHYVFAPFVISCCNRLELAIITVFKLSSKEPSSLNRPVELCGRHAKIASDDGEWSKLKLNKRRSSHSWWRSVTHRYVGGRQTFPSFTQSDMPTMPLESETREQWACLWIQSLFVRRNDLPMLKQRARRLMEEKSCNLIVEWISAFTSNSCDLMGLAGYDARIDFIY